VNVADATEWMPGSNLGMTTVGVSADQNAAIVFVTRSRNFRQLCSVALFMS
jgi:hypothetical protein